jgi:hypothetical protein
MGGTFFESGKSVADDQSGWRLLVNKVDLAGRTLKALTWHPREMNSVIKGKKIMV